MMDPLDILWLVASRLGQAGIEYMLSGSLAMNYYAEPRMTRDIDIVLQIEPMHVDALIALFFEDFYVSRTAIEEALRYESVFNLIHNESIYKIDCIVRKSSPYRQMEFSRRRQVDIGGRSFWIVASEDLILSKLEWSRESQSALQNRDIENLISCVPDLDRQYLESWAARLGVSERLIELLDGSGR